MTTPTSGPISLQNVQTEFGGSNPIGFDEYYRGGANVPAGVATGTGAFFTSPASSAAIPSSGPIQLSQFYGVSKQFVFNDVISSNFTGGYSLGVRASAAGWDGVSPLIATTTVNYGVTITGLYPYPALMSWRLATNAVGPSSNYPVGSSYTLVNNGNIMGAGGTAGGGGSVINGSFINGGNGDPGAPGIQFFGGITTYVSNNGCIGGGGGGGGGGNATLNDPTFKLTTFYGGGGGGGGAGAAATATTFGGAAGQGTPNSGGGVAGTAGGVASNPTQNNISPSVYTYGAPGAGGVIGSVVRGGDGGAGGEPGMAGFPGWLGDQGYINGGQSAFGAGGAAGPAIQNSSFPTYYNYGQIRGSMSGGLGFWGSGGSDNSGLMSGLTNPVRNSYPNAAWTGLLGPVWYGPSQNSGRNNVVAATYFYRMFVSNNGAPYSAHLYGACDNQFTGYFVNASGLQSGAALGGFNGVANAYTTTYSTANFTIPTGVTVIVIQILNSATSVHGFNIRLRTSAFVDVTHPSMWYI